MEELVEEVASQHFGAKWQQFYHRLGLEYRDRFRISVEHKDKAEADRIRCCVEDTIALWLKSEPVVKQSEREKMKLLLNALQSVQGFETLAVQLSDRHGVHLEKATSAYKHKQSTISQLDPGGGKGATASSEKTQTVPDQEGVKYKRVEVDGGSPWIKDEAPSTDSSPSRGRHDKESATWAMSSDQMLTEQLEESSSSYSVPLSTTAASLYNQEILQVPIDMANTVHKFAVLDVVQRISINNWTRFSSLLGLSKETVEVLSREKASEERYYKSINEWLKMKRERATFAVLNELLEECREHGAQIVMKRRLECNRGTCTLEPGAS